jgi:UV DNA damage endonuclease
MRIGYPCINRSMGCKSDRTFRLRNYSEKRLIETVENNLDCLNNIFRFNLENELLFFRITSDLVPFASHPICKFKWQEHFAPVFQGIGDLIKKNRIRISMHPDQYIVINSKSEDIVNNSVRELFYHTDLLNAMGLDNTAKIQIHLGGVYGDKRTSIERFVNNYEQLDDAIKERLVIENDDTNYNLSDCLSVSRETGIPVLMDYFHNKVNSSSQNLTESLRYVNATWKAKDGCPMVDYSSHHPSKRPKMHAESIDIQDFRNFLNETKSYDIDIMLEIKDKEKSAMKALKVARRDDRFVGNK